MWIIAWSLDIRYKVKNLNNLRLKLSRVSSKKVPAISLALVAIVGMIAGVLAANIVVTSNSFTGTTGTYTANTGTMTVADNGLSIVVNVPGTTNSSATFFTSGNKNLNYNGQAFVVGHWMESIVFTDTATDTAVHSVKITINNGTTAPGGSALIGQATLSLTGSGTAGGTITAFIDLGTASVTAPMSVYVTST